MVAGDPVRVSVCHCLACQRRTGSVFGAQARFERSQLIATSGAYSTYRRVADSGNGLDFHFCPACGATVWYELLALPEVFAVPVGAFADPEFPAPRLSVYEARRHPWASVPSHPGVEHFD
jgi:hypothetical protein